MEIQFLTHVLYDMRHTGYTNLQKHEDVIRDCTEALRLDPAYVKALNRRATSREQLGGDENLFKALCGACATYTRCFTMSC